jgi:hypothetical protein
MRFQAEQFGSATEALRYIAGEYALKPNVHVRDQCASGLLYTRELPPYLFRGECGEFDTTMDGARRFQAEFLGGKTGLSAPDVVRLSQLILWLVGRLGEKPYCLTAFALLHCCSITGYRHGSLTSLGVLTAHSPSRHRENLHAGELRLCHTPLARLFGC